MYRGRNPTLRKCFGEDSFFGLRERWAGSATRLRLSLIQSYRWEWDEKTSEDFARLWRDLANASHTDRDLTPADQWRFLQRITRIVLGFMISPMQAVSSNRRPWELTYCLILNRRPPLRKEREAMYDLYASELNDIAVAKASIRFIAQDAVACVHAGCCRASDRATGGISIMAFDHPNNCAAQF